MVEVLQRMLTDLASAKVAIDADMPFILQLETQIVDHLRDPVRKMQEQGLLPPGQAPPAQQQPQQQGPPPAPPSGPSFQGAGMPGLQQGPGAPNADELGRLLSSGQ